MVRFGWVGCGWVGSGMVRVLSTTSKGERVMVESSRRSWVASVLGGLVGMFVGVRSPRKWKDGVFVYEFKSNPKMSKESMKAVLDRYDEYRRCGVMRSRLTSEGRRRVCENIRRMLAGPVQYGPPVVVDGMIKSLGS